MLLNRTVSLTSDSLKTGALKIAVGAGTERGYYIPDPRIPYMMGIIHGVKQDRI